LTCSVHGKAAVGARPFLFRKFVLVVCWGLIASVLAGCMTKRNSYDVPVIPLPAQYKNSSSKDTPELTSTSVVATVKAGHKNVLQSVELVEWWRSFGNSELIELIDRGLANNPDVRIATQQMAEAQTRVDQARAGMLPALSAPIEFANQAPGGSIGIVTPGQGPGSQKTFQASLQGTWRADLWGERSSLAESAKFQLWQAAFNRDNVQRNMAANLASSYVEYLALNDRLRLARGTETVLSRMLDSVEKRMAVGDATVIELDQQKAATFAVRAAIPSLEQQREDVLTSIAFLVGSVPGSLHLTGNGLDTLNLPTAVPPLPSSLLLRRPDVRMAEARMLSADADVDVARARMLPPLDLSGQVGHSSLAMSQFFQPSTLFWNAIANLTVSIFDGGKLKSDKKNAQALHEEMVESYARTIYQAAKEVESALAAIRLTGNRLASQKEATVSARRAWDSSDKVYAVGGLDYQGLLDAERNYHHYLDDYLHIKMESFHGYISLFQALGGGVNFVDPLPGKEAHAVLAGRNAPESNSTDVPEYTTPVPKPGVVTEGVDWIPGGGYNEPGALQVENFWQVELPGLYHHSTIGATWRDLRTRYPKLMGSRIVRPRLDGKMDNSRDAELSLFRLYVSKFSTPQAAQELCAALMANYQRCRVVSSRLEDVAVEPALPQKISPPLSVSSEDVRDAERVSGEFTSGDAIAKSGEPAPGDPVLKSEPVLREEVKALAANITSPDSSVASVRQNNAKEKISYEVQLGAFSTLENAQKLQSQWQINGYKTYVREIRDASKRTLYAVRTGEFVQRREALAILRIFKRKEGIQATLINVVVNHDNGVDGAYHPT